MGTAYTYKCGCENPEPLLIGVGKQKAKICSDTWNDMKAGKYGFQWMRAVSMHPEGGLDCEYVIYVCDCGCWKKSTKKTLWEKGDRDHCKIRLPRNRMIKRFYHICPDCQKRTRIADFENDLIVCPKCGEGMTDFTPIFQWD